MFFTTIHKDKGVIISEGDKSITIRVSDTNKSNSARILIEGRDFTITPEPVRTKDETSKTSDVVSARRGGVSVPDITSVSPDGINQA